MNYYQYIYFSDIELEKVNNNLIIIGDKIKAEINRMSMGVERLRMSKSCIKYYYNI